MPKLGFLTSALFKTAPHSNRKEIAKRETLILRLPLNGLGDLLPALLFNDALSDPKLLLMLMLADFKLNFSSVLRSALEEESSNTPAINNIPQVLHFFWVGSVMPDYAADNLLSFVKCLPEGWKINVWVTDPAHLLRAKYFRDVATIPNCIVIQDVHALLDSKVFTEIERKFPQYDISGVQSIIKSELLGLGNPAAAKDILTCLITFVHGGYLFDVDSIAQEKLTSPKSAPHGVLMVANGKSIGAFAAEKGHELCAMALAIAKKSYANVTDLMQKYSRSLGVEDYAARQAPSKGFFNAQPLRDRQNPARDRLTIHASGSILRLASISYIKKHGIQGSEYDWGIYVPGMNFPYAKDRADLTMGIKLAYDAPPEKDWRKPEKRSKSFEAEDVMPLRKPSLRI